MTFIRGVYLILFSVFSSTYCASIPETISYLSIKEFLYPGLSSGQESFTKKTGDLVANFTNTSAGNPEELGEYFEGDIRIPSQAHVKLGYLSAGYRWPNGVVPYTIDGKFSSDELNMIKWAMDEFRQKSCINFKPRSRERDYVSIVSGRSGCWAAAGRIGGKQEVNLQTPGCMWRRGVVLHELMHAVGVLHEQNRHDRDNYVTIHMRNIESDKQYNFTKKPKNIADGFGYPYDYSSVMHYSGKAFSKNGKPTITAKADTEETKKMGQRNEFSELDLAKLRAMYKC